MLNAGPRIMVGRTCKEKAGEPRHLCASKHAYLLTGAQIQAGVIDNIINLKAAGPKPNFSHPFSSPSRNERFCGDDIEGVSKGNDVFSVELFHIGNGFRIVVVLVMPEPCLMHLRYSDHSQELLQP